MIKIAYGSVPKDGGTFTFYRNQRPALMQRGFDLRCVTVGAREAGITEQAYVDDGSILLAEKEHSLKKQAQVFAKWCEDEEVQIVIGVNSEAILSALPHLPQHIRVISRCANAFDEGYRYATVCQERYAAMVALTPRLQNDLVEGYGSDVGLFHLIPNGIDPIRFQEAADTPRARGDVLELGFLGRLEHKQKGVLYLPEIVSNLRASKVPFKLRIAGKGAHRKKLEDQMQDAVREGQVEFVGQLTPDEIPNFLANTDLYLFTSHFEGCPNSLLEAMMAGCVPVSWVIEGITDFLIEDGETGYLVPAADCEVFADIIAKLAGDRDRVRAMSGLVAQTARAKYTNNRASDAYAKLFHEIIEKKPPLWIPRPWDSFEVPSAFKRGWKSRIPAPIKRGLRKVIGK